MSLPTYLHMLSSLSLSKKHSLVNAQSVVDYDDSYNVTDWGEQGKSTAFTTVSRTDFFRDYTNSGKYGLANDESFTYNYNYDKYYDYNRDRRSASMLMTGSYDNDVRVCNIYINYDKSRMVSVEDSTAFLLNLVSYINTALSSSFSDLNQTDDNGEGGDNDTYNQNSTNVRAGLSFTLVDNNVGNELLGYIKTAMDVAFNVITGIAMLLCAFSLFAAMNTNVLDQSVDIGIMRSVGVSGFSLIRQFIEECFILVGTAIFIGTAVGMVITIGFVLIISVLVGTPLVLYFPDRKSVV